MARTVEERIEKLKTIRDSMEDRLADMLLRPKPSYNVDGQDFKFTEYQKFLSDQVKELTVQILELEDSGDDGGKLTRSQVFTG